MPLAIHGDVLEPAVPAQFDVFTDFELDVQVTVDAAVGYFLRGCDSSDTCGSTCASACISS